MKPATESQALEAIFADCRYAALGPVLFNVFDGDDWCLDSATDNIARVAEAVLDLDEARLVVFSPAGTRLGSFLLIFGNAEDGEELIADYGINEFTDRVWDLFSERYA